EGRPIASQIAEQVEMLQHIYNLTSQPQWLDAVATILSSSEVFVTAHLSLACLGRHLCDRLEFARDHLHFLDGVNGSYIELLGHQSADALLVIIDSPRFAASRLLARSARRSGYKVLLITSQYTEWAHEFANMTLSLPPPRNGNRENITAMMALLELLAAAVIHSAGEEAENRIRRIEELEGMFAPSPLR
ncbi:MAG: MurR/RpiR family transcriptional regulator, partial [Rhizobiaceae bacterium]|nr:MurR/RpiR family transcriptional regulator [Rhizobiaceae bacterium]